jgi:hypothetical protein
VRCERGFDHEWPSKIKAPLKLFRRHGRRKSPGPLWGRGLDRSTSRPTRCGENVLGLTAVPFLPTDAVSVLLAATHHAAETGTALTIAASPPAVRRPDLYGVTAALTLAPTTEPPPPP